MTAKLFLTDYFSYNNGTQFEYGHWVNLTQFDSVESFNNYVTNHFLKCGINDPEPMYTDCDGLPDELYGESLSPAELQAIFDYVNNPFNIYKQIENADTDELVRLYNIACEVLKYNDDTIYSFDEDFFTTFFNNKPMEAARAATFGNVNWSDDWIMFDGNGNLESITSAVDIDTNRIIEAYKEEPSAFN
jgi:hypothetical protein